MLALLLLRLLVRGPDRPAGRCRPRAVAAYVGRLSRRRRPDRVGRAAAEGARRLLAGHPRAGPPGRRAGRRADQPSAHHDQGYGGLVDQCGFGVSFDSYTFVVSVGLAPATRADLATLPGEPVDGVGDAARAADLARFTTVSFLRGSTLAQVLAVKPSDEASAARGRHRRGRGHRAHRPDGPAGDRRPDRRASAPVWTSRPSTACSAHRRASRGPWSTRTAPRCARSRPARGTPARSPSASTATPRPGRSSSSQKKYLDSTPVPGIDAGTAFTIPGTAYVVAEDGQAVSVVGHFPPDTPARKPLRVTPELTALLTSAATLMQ